MSSPRFCNLCNRNVIPSKNFNGVVFLLLLFLGIIPGIIYLIYYLAKSRKCPICKSTSFGPAKANLMGN